MYDEILVMPYYAGKKLHDNDFLLCEHMLRLWDGEIEITQHPAGLYKNKCLSMSFEIW